MPEIARLGVGDERRRWASAQGRDEVPRQGAAILLHDAEPRRRATAKGRAEQQDDEHRQDEQKEHVRPPAKQPARIRARDRDHLHRATSRFARVKATPPVMSANARIATTGPSTALAPGSTGKVPDASQEPGLWGGEAEHRDQAARLRDREERPAEHAEHEGDHALPRLRLIRASARMSQRAPSRPWRRARSAAIRRATPSGLPQSPRGGSVSRPRARPCSRSRGSGS